MRRRPLLIGISVLIVVGIALALYFVLFRDTAELVVPDDPFAGIGSGLIDGEGPGDMDSGAGDEVAPRLIRITDRPVAEGVIAIARTATTTTTVEGEDGTVEVVETPVTDTEIRFIDRASGNIYRFMAHGRSLTRLSNRTMPGVQEASWLPNGSVAYARFLTGDQGNEQVATYVLPENGEGGFFLEQGLAAAKTTPSGGLFTMLSGTTGSVGSLSQSDGIGARTVFTSLLSSLAVHPTNANFFGYTKPSAFLDGYAFQIGASSGAFTRVLGPLRGLSALPSPDGTQLLYSYLDRNTPRLAVLNVATRESVALPVATLTEKCFWTANSASIYCGIPTGLPNGLPDLWYQGAVSFSDRLWRIDMGDRLATLMVDPNAAAGISIDAVALHTDPQEDVLLFTDRNTGSLWAYDL